MPVPALLSPTVMALDKIVQCRAGAEDGLSLFRAIGGVPQPDMNRSCAELADRLGAPREIMNRTGREKYLSRWYLLGGPVNPATAYGPQGELLPRTPWTRLPVELYLHRFHAGDEDTALHSHPWSIAASFILAGGYYEDRRVGCEVKRSLFGPGSFNVLRANDFHRVDLVEEDAWSLFITGPPCKTWHFWDPETNRQMPWREFLASRVA